LRAVVRHLGEVREAEERAVDENSDLVFDRVLTMR